ncbi:MAG TPA: hypothetical protein VJH03_14830 [Blastocatellia bacterium]|nr:hypothetical protein [Blastocatellia bacterium]
MPDINSKEFIDALILQDWETYAEFAYQEFLRMGRGAIFIDLNEAKISIGSQGEQSFEFDGFKYFSINNPDFLGQEIHDKILAYNPASEVVFVLRLRMLPLSKQGEFEMAPTVVFGGNVKGRPSPKELYESRHQEDTASQ